MQVELFARRSAARLVVVALIAFAGLTGKASHAATAPSAPVDLADTLSGNYLAAVVAGADRDTGAAAAYYREALRGDPRNVDILERAFAASLANGDVTQGVSLADRLVLRDSGNSLARLALAARAFSQGQFAIARAQLSAGQAGKIHDITTTLLTAWAFAGARDERHALDALDQVKDPTLEVFRDFHAGLIADMLGDANEADRRLKAAYEGDKNTLRLADAYARFLDRRGDHKGARDIYDEYDKQVPSHPLVEAALADINAGRPLAPIVRDAREGAAEALYGLGGAGRGQEDDLAALIYLRLALFLRPDHDLAAVTMADVFEQAKQFEQEVEAFDLVPAASPMRESAEIQAAMTLDSLEKSAEATARVQKLIAANPKDVDAVVALGDLQRSAKNYQDAAATYDKAIALVGEPTRANWTLFYFRGICNERLKHWPLAEADFKKALDLFPDQPLVLNYLGYSWVDQGVNLDEAFRMLRRAVELRPTDGYIVDSLGWAHFKLGHYTEAMDALEKAVELKPSDPTINDHLGDVYWRIGRKLEAHFQWNHARDMGPDPEDLPAILKKIDNGLPDQPPNQEAAAPAQSPEPTPSPSATDTPANGAMNGAPSSPAASPEPAATPAPETSPTPTPSSGG